MIVSPGSWPLERSARSVNSRPRLAAVEMVVDEAHRLHERVHGGRPDEPPTAALEILRERRGLGCQRELREACAIELSSPWTRLEAPDVARERALLFDELERTLRVVDDRLDLAAVAHDPRVREQALDVALAEAGDAPEVEAGEGRPERVALAQDRQPRQARLKALEAQLLEQPHVVGNREAPLCVVIGEVLGSRARPPAARDRVRARQQAVDGRLAHSSRPRGSLASSGQ